MILPLLVILSATRHSHAPVQDKQSRQSRDGADLIRHASRLIVRSGLRILPSREMGKRNLQASHDVAGWVDACVLPSARTANATWVLTLLLLFNCQTSSAATSLPPTAGPVLSVAPDGLHLRLDGKPWFWLADTAWLAIWQLDERGITDYLEDRASRGIRIIQGQSSATKQYNHPTMGASTTPSSATKSARFGSTTRSGTKSTTS
ncbi:MAG: DUF4038 domain-containing protein [Pseudomonadales bacterium]